MCVICAVPFWKKLFRGAKGIRRIRVPRPGPRGSVPGLVVHGIVVTEVDHVQCLRG